MRTHITNRLSYSEISTALRASWYARSAYPGPVGQLIARELTAYVDTNVHAAPCALTRRVLEDVLRLPGAPRPHPDYRRPCGCPNPCAPQPTLMLVEQPDHHGHR